MSSLTNNHEHLYRSNLTDFLIISTGIPDEDEMIWGMVIEGVCDLYPAGELLPFDAGQFQRITNRYIPENFDYQDHIASYNKPDSFLRWVDTVMGSDQAKHDFEYANFSLNSEHDRKKILTNFFLAISVEGNVMKAEISANDTPFKFKGIIKENEHA